MWQIYCVVSLLFQAIEETVDKAAMVNNKTIDLVTSTWIRNGIFLIIAFGMMLLLDREVPDLIFSRPIILLGICYGANAIFYSLFLRHIEISASTILASCIPLFFLPIDLFIVERSISTVQIIGVVLLTFGSILFFARKGAFALSKNYIQIAIGMFLFDAALYGFESYLFQNYHMEDRISETVFLVNTWLIAFLFLTIALCICRIGSIYKLNIHGYRKYIQSTVISKFADYGNSLFLLKALGIASVAQVSSMNAFYPIILFTLVILIQLRLKVNLDEYLNRKLIRQKILSLIIIGAGSILVR